MHGLFVSSCREMLGFKVPQRAQPLFVSCHHSVGHSSETAGNKPEEGGDDVKSSCPLMTWATHGATMAGTTSRQAGDGKLISESQSQFGL